MTRLTALSHFIAVARTTSFTLAAKEVNASQSVVSRSVQRLEDEVGTSLFERSTRSVSLTPAGSALFADAIQIINKMAVATDNARRIGQGDVAEIRIGICPTTETPRIVHALSRFREQWPNVGLRLSAIMSNLQPDSLRSSTIDVGIMQGDGSRLEKLEQRILDSYALALAVPAAWGFTPGKPVRLRELADRPWLMPNRAIAAELHDALVEMCRRAGFEPRVVGAMDEPVTARIMVSCGLGAAFFHDKGWRDPTGSFDLLTFEDSQDLIRPAMTAVVWHCDSTAPQISALVECLMATG